MPFGAGLGRREAQQRQSGNSIPRPASVNGVQRSSFSGGVVCVALAQSLVAL